MNDVLANTDAGILVFLGAGNGAGTLIMSSNIYPGGEFAVSDLDGDGNPDLLALPADSSSGFNVYPGDGAGNFGTPVHITTSRSYAHITIADLNLDGVPDVILSGTEVGVMYGDGKGGFGPEQVLLASTVPQTAMVGDWNQDGAPDIAVTNSTGASPSSESISLFLNRAGDATSLSATANPAQYGQPVAITAIVAPTVLGSGTPGGNVSLSVDGAPAFQGALADGSYSADIGTLAVGGHTLAGSYVGDGNFLSKAFAPMTLTIAKAQTSTLLATGSNPAVYGTNVALTVAVRPAYSGVPSGTVTVWDGTQSIATANLDASGQANFSLSNLMQGTHAFSAQYAGDVNFVGSNSATLSQSVLYPSKVGISSSAPLVLVGSTVTFTATVNSQYGSPTGAIIFLDGNRVLGQVNVTGGFATLIVPSLTPGMHSIQAAYQGDGTFIAANSSVLTQGITDFSIEASISSLTLSAGASANDQLSVVPVAGFSGTVAFTCAGAPSLATCTVTPASVLVDGTAATANVSITTTGPNKASAVNGGGVGARARTVLTGIFFSGAIGVFGFVASFRRVKHRYLLCFALASATLALNACGGAKPSTPHGTTPLTITASTTSGDITVSHTVTLALTVK